VKLRNTLIMFGVVVVLFALVYALEIQRPHKDSQKSKNLGKILQMEVENVNKVELIYTVPENKNIVFSRDKKGQWQVDQPPKAKIDQKVMSDLVSDVVKISIYKAVENPGTLADYGLSKPHITAIFHLRDGTHRKLMVGNEVPIGSYVYLKEESSPDILMVPASIRDDLTKPASSLRDDQTKKI